MSELNAASDETKQMWDYIKNNRRIVGIPVSNNNGLDILNVLRDIYDTIDEDPVGAKNMLTLVASVILAAAHGDGEKLVNEIQVVSAMEDFDKSIKEILDEKS